MNPACPIENWPVKPLIRLSETARITLIPHSMSTWITYGLNTRGMTALTASSTARSAASHRTCFTSHLLARRLAEQAGGTHQQDDDQQHERDRIPVGRR